MVDFSRYGGASDELLKLQASLPPAPELSLEELKRTTNDGREAYAREEMKQFSDKISKLDHSIPSRDGTLLRARTYRPRSLSDTQALPIYLHFHGGGFFFGTLDSEDGICARIALNAEVVVLNLNYRHTPEHKFPTQWKDIEDAFDWVQKHSEDFGGDATQVVVGGISAGGQLAAALVHTKFRSKDPARTHLRGQVLMIPCLMNEAHHEPFLRRYVDASKFSFVENEHAPILPVERIRMFDGLLYNEPPAFDDRRVNIVDSSNEEVRGLPPATFGIAGLDPLRDEGLVYAQQLAKNGVPTNVHLFKGVPHGFRRYGDRLTASKHWDQVMSDGIRWALSNPESTDETTIHVHP